jgi:polyphosphate kinase
VRAGLIDRIEQETANHLQGLSSRIRFKVNSIVDEAIIDALYEASRAGVPIDIWVRGICAIKVGVPDLSETIRVRSILGRFLEHSRIYWFDGAGRPDAWIGSADLMHRNLDRRVEALVRITGEEHLDKLGELLDLGFDENLASWHLRPDGEWVRVNHSPDGEPLTDLQTLLIQRKRSARRSPLG